MAAHSVVFDFTGQPPPPPVELHDMLREMRAALAEGGAYELHGDELRRVIALLEAEGA